MDSRLRRCPADHASVVPYGQAGENAQRFPGWPTGRRLPSFQNEDGAFIFHHHAGGDGLNLRHWPEHMSHPLKFYLLQERATDDEAARPAALPPD